MEGEQQRTHKGVVGRAPGYKKGRIGGTYCGRIGRPWWGSPLWVEGIGEKKNPLMGTGIHLPQTEETTRRKKREEKKKAR